MKKILPILIAFILSHTFCFAIEDTVELQTKEKTLSEKINDIYHLEIEQTDKPYFLLNEILTKKCSEDSIWDSFQFWAAYNAHATLNFEKNENMDGRYDFNYINIGLDGKLKDNNADFRIMLNYSPTATRDFAQNLFADMYIATNKIPNNRFWLGNTRPPVGMEGGYSPFLLPFVNRSQIARNFGTVRRLGARVSGKYSLVDYDLGVYSSDTYFQSFFPGTEFIGWMNLKPLGMTDGRYGKLTLGGGVQAGHRDNSYRVAGSYVGYEYKKWLMNFEYSDADGYNGPIGYSIDKKATGFYSTLAYKFTPKIQGLLRYDYFDPNKKAANNGKKEYVAGINYFVKGQAVKLMLNYVYCQNEALKNSHRIILGSQFVL